MKFQDPNTCGTPYWICDFCATERGGVMFKTGSTSSSGLKCGYCAGEFQVEQYIYPSVDYLWPSQIAKHPDGGRRSADRIARQTADGQARIYDNFCLDEWPSPEAIIELREKSTAWKKFYEKEFARIQNLWGFK